MSASLNNGPTLDELLRAAIEHRRMIRFRYNGQERIVEPHDYGIHKGSAKLLGYQVAGSQPRQVAQLAMVGGSPDL